MASQYVNPYGKLVLSISIPVDERIKKISEEAKSRKFDFNAWARDAIASRLHEVLEACNMETPKDAA